MTSNRTIQLAESSIKKGLRSDRIRCRGAHSIRTLYAEAFPTNPMETPEDGLRDERCTGTTVTLRHAPEESRMLL